MVDMVLDYMERKGARFSSQEELQEVIGGIRLFLLENGLKEDDRQEYYKTYLMRCLDRIEKRDLIVFFQSFAEISRVQQICMEYCAKGTLGHGRVDQLRESMVRLYNAGLSDRYIPAAEVKLILGKLS